MAQEVPGATQISQGEKVVTGLTIAVLAVAFVAGGFGALADGRPPSSQESFRNASAYLSAMPGQVTGRRPVCQLAYALE
jgi:hypothetical protein